MLLQMEPMQRLAQIISATSEALLRFITTASQPPEVRKEMLSSHSADMWRAQVSLMAIGEKDSIEALKTVQDILTKMLATEDQGAKIDLAPDLMVALALLETRYIALKKQTILSQA